jgi:uncharacterized protein
MPVRPHSSVFRPLPANAVRLAPQGLLGAWQERNAAATLPHVTEQLHAHGNLANLRQEGDFTGFWFADTDVHKTLEALYWERGRSGNLPPFAAETVALLEKAQDPDGYLNSYYQHPARRDQQWTELHFSHEMYTAGHLIQAAVAAARTGTPGDPIVRVARRFADLLVERFSESEETDGHPEVETALVELYRVTGHRPYLDLAARLIDNRGHGVLGEGRFGSRYFQDHEPVRSASEVAGHAVRQLYLLTGAVDVAVETGDAELLAAAERLWDSAQRSRTYLTGGQGSRHRDESFGDAYELPPDRAYAETCAAIGSFQLAWRLLLATGDRRYADEMERVLLNGIAAGISSDGKAFFYSNPLQLRTGHDGSDEDAPSRRLPWYSCACCPPNLARLMASLHSYAATGTADTLQLHLYAEGTITSAGRVVDIATDYPWDPAITIAVAETPETPWTLDPRIPSWCSDARLEVNGAPVPPGPITRTWHAGDRAVLTLPMPPRLVASHPRVDATRGAAALVRGPLVYCLEQAGLPDGVLLEDLELDLGAPLSPDSVPVRVRTGDLPLHRFLTVDGTTLTVDSTPPTVDPSGPPMTVSAIPYFQWANRTPGPMRVWIPIRR